MRISNNLINDSSHKMAATSSGFAPTGQTAPVSGASHTMYNPKPLSQSVGIRPKK